MALIKCPECNKEVSDKAASCIGCGYPLSPNTLQTPQETTATRGNVIDKHMDKIGAVKLKPPSSPPPPIPSAPVLKTTASTQNTPSKNKLSTERSVLLGIAIAIIMVGVISLPAYLAHWRTTSGTPRPTEPTQTTVTHATPTPTSTPTPTPTPEPEPDPEPEPAPMHSINLIYPNTPITSNRRNSRGGYSTIRIDEIHYETEYHPLSDTVSLRIFISGEKIYDSDGDLNRRQNAPTYTLMVGDVIVFMCYIYTPPLIVGERFENGSSRVITGLTPGITYTLIITETHH